VFSETRILKFDTGWKRIVNVNSQRHCLCGNAISTVGYARTNVIRARTSFVIASVCSSIH
jgi:hypothetical protein